MILVRIPRIIHLFLKIFNHLCFFCFYSVGHRIYDTPASHCDPPKDPFVQYQLQVGHKITTERKGNSCTTINNQVYYSSSLKSFEFEFEFGTLVLNCTLLLGYEAILNTVEGFYWLFLIAITCRWLLLASRVCSCYWTLLGIKVSKFCQGSGKKKE